MEYSCFFLLFFFLETQAPFASSNVGKAGHRFNDVDSVVGSYEQDALVVFRVGDAWNLPSDKIEALMNANKNKKYPTGVFQIAGEFLE